MSASLIRLGDRVCVVDPPLGERRGTVAHIDPSGTVVILFDDGQMAPYPAEDTRPL